MVPSIPDVTSFQFANGKQPMSQYGSFGIANQRMWVKPGKLRGILLGEFNSGKTSFLGSNPGALIINLDLSSTPVPSSNSPGLPAQFWPGLNEDGLPIDFNSSVIKLSWETLSALRSKLIEAARLNQPRPETVVIDGLTEWLNMMRRATLLHFGKETWDEGRGDAMWEWLYGQMLLFMNDLRDAGYGLWVVAHISSELPREGSASKDVRWSLNAPPGFFKRFYGSFELALELRKTLKVTVEQEEYEVVVAGKPTKMKRPKSVTQTFFTLNGEDPERSSLYKRRVAFPATVTVPPTNAWALFVDEYLKVAKPSGTLVDPSPSK